MGSVSDDMNWTEEQVLAQALRSAANLRKLAVARFAQAVVDRLLAAPAASAREAANIVYEMARDYKGSR